MRKHLWPRRAAGIYLLAAILFASDSCLAQEGVTFIQGARSRGGSDTNTVLPRGPRAGRGAVRMQVQRPPGMMPARLQATIYEVLVPTNGTSSLSAADLTARAGTADSLFQALQEAGKARLLYQVDQPVNVFADNITVGASEPVLTQTGLGSNSTVAYITTGLILRLSAQALPGKASGEALEATLSAQVSTLPQGKQEESATPGMNLLHAASLKSTEPLKFGMPVVTLAPGTNRPGVEVAPAFYVLRHEFTRATGATTETRVAEETEAEFQVTLYELQLAPGRAVGLDAEVLRRHAGSAGSLLKALGELGRAQMVCHLDQPANIFSNQFQGSITVPMTTLSKTGARGAPIRNLQNQRAGAIIASAAFPPPADAARKEPDLVLDLQFSSASQSDVQPGPGQQATLIHLMSLRHSEPLQFDQPQVLLAVRPGTGTETNPVASVVRYVYHQPGRKDGATASMVATDGKLPAQFQAAVYEVRLLPGRIGDVDAAALTRESKTSEELLNRLNEMGKTEVLFRMDQPVDAMTDSIHLETSQPVTGVQTGVAGRASTTERVEKTTVDVTLSANPPPAAPQPKAPETKVALVLSIPDYDSVQPLAAIAPMPRRTLAFEHAETIHPGRPVIMLYANSSSLNDPAAPVLYVVRYLFAAPVKK